MCPSLKQHVHFQPNRTCSGGTNFISYLLTVKMSYFFQIFFQAYILIKDMANMMNKKKSGIIHSEFMKGEIFLLYFFIINLQE